MEIASQIRNSLLKKWKSIRPMGEMPVYFYVVSQSNTGWGVVVPEMLGVLKHAAQNQYCVCFIANPGSNTETLRLFDIGSNLNIWGRETFLQISKLDKISQLLGHSAGNAGQLKEVCTKDQSIRQLFPEMPNFDWPFSDVLRCIIHSTEFVHPAFTLWRSIYANFENLTLHGMLPGEKPLKLSQPNTQLAQQILGSDESKRFVLSVREAPACHGLDRNTNPEALDQLLLIIKKFTRKVNLIGTSPGKAITAVLKKHSDAIKIIDHTYTSYETHELHSENNQGLSKHLVQSHLLSTENIKLLPTNGIVVIPLAAGKLYGAYDTPNIFSPWVNQALIIPRRFRFAPDLSPIQAFITGLTNRGGSEWIFDRYPPSLEATLSAFE